MTLQEIKKELTAKGVNFNKDYFELNSSERSLILSYAKHYKYYKKYNQACCLGRESQRICGFYYYLDRVKA